MFYAEVGGKGRVVDAGGGGKLEIIGMPLFSSSLFGISAKTDSRPHVAVAFAFLKAAPDVANPLPESATMEDDLKVAGIKAYWVAATADQIVAVTGVPDGFAIDDEVWWVAAGTPDMADITNNPAILPSTGAEIPPPVMSGNQGGPYGWQGQSGQQGFQGQYGQQGNQGQYGQGNQGQGQYGHTTQGGYGQDNWNQGNQGQYGQGHQGGPNQGQYGQGGYGQPQQSYQGQAQPTSPQQPSPRRVR